MGGGFLAMIIMENNQDTDDKKVVVIDHTGMLAEPILAAVDLRNQNEIYDQETGEKVRPTYNVEFASP